MVVDDWQIPHALTPTLTLMLMLTCAEWASGTETGSKEGKEEGTKRQQKEDHQASTARHWVKSRAWGGWANGVPDARNGE